MSSFHRGKAILAGRATDTLPVESCNYARRSQTLSDKFCKLLTLSIELQQSKIQTPSGQFRCERRRAQRSPCRSKSRKEFRRIEVGDGPWACRPSQGVMASSGRLHEDQPAFKLPIQRREARLVVGRALLLRLAGLAGSRVCEECA